MKLRTVIIALLALAVGLPMLQALLMWVGGLLGAMGDAEAASVLRGLNTAVGVAWLASLVALVVSLAINALNDDRQEP